MSIKARNAWKPVVGVVLSFILWYIVFLFDVLSGFWVRVTIASIFLAFFAFWASGNMFEVEIPRILEVLKGVISGVFLYGLFKVGYAVFQTLVMRSAENVYAMRSDSPLIHVVLFLVVTSFCEEYFWRWFIQGFMVSRIGVVSGILLTTFLYGAIHLPTMNLPLVFAAFIAGLFWGILYEYSRSIWIVVFSHMVWTELIFVFSPLS